MVVVVTVRGLVVEAPVVALSSSLSSSLSLSCGALQQEFEGRARSEQMGMEEVALHILRNLNPKP